MQGRKNLYIALGIVLLAGVLLFYLLSMQPKRYNWQETFQHDGKQPYDLSIFRALMVDFFPGKGFEVVSSLRDDTLYLERTSAVFIYIDGRAFIDSAQAVRFRKFAEKGNTVFVSASNAHGLVEQLCEECGVPAQGKWIQSRKAKNISPRISGHEPVDANMYYQIMDEVQRYPWPYYDVDGCNFLNTEKTGRFTAIEKEYTNMLEAKVGKGRIILHCTPMIFSNLHIIRPEILEHAEQLLMRIPEADVVYFEPNWNSPPPPNRPLLTESPLRFILGNTSLRWAWYLLLGLSLLYVISQLRREQRSIPIITAPENKTLGLVEVMSRLYRKEGKHKDVVALQHKMLINHLRRRYRIQHHPADGRFYTEASTKLGKSESNLKTFFAELDAALNNSALTDKELIALDKKITDFYTTCP